VQRFAAAVLASSASPASAGIAIHAFNEPRWFFATLGALAAGWTVTGIYLTNTYDQAKHVLKTSEVRVLVLESAELLETTYRTVLKDFADLTVVILRGLIHDASPRVLSYDAFLAKGSAMQPSTLTPPAQLSKDVVASLVYTSGTTGNPKAMELTHENMYTVCAMMHARIPLNERTVIVSYLPLSHIAAMGIDLYSSVFCGATVHFADRNALHHGKILPLPCKGSGMVLQTIGTAAKLVGSAWWSANTSDLARSFVLAVPFGFFKILAYRKVRRGCGLDRCQLLYTGAAPLPAKTVQYLRSVDMPLLEVFGMSESTGAIAVCGPSDGARPIGACGKALPEGELKIAEDGEILWKGKYNMIGYKGQPAATRASLSDEGWLLTGDLGRIDESGYLFITGRKKDLIITAGGENVAPAPIEQTFRSLLGSNEGHVVLIGDERKFLTILVAPGEGYVKVPESAEIEMAIKEYNEVHAKSRAQRIQKAHVLEHPFLVDSGELTPTMKVKRRFVVEKYASEIDAMYDGSATLVGYSSMNIGKLQLAV
jgi:long-subunit acyl-CoA synthetase (AMP-forming)